MAGRGIATAGRGAGDLGRAAGRTTRVDRTTTGGRSVPVAAPGRAGSGEGGAGGSVCASTIAPIKKQAAVESPVHARKVERRYLIPTKLGTLLKL